MDTLPAPLALPAPTPALPAAPTLGAAELLGHWLSGRSPRTREAYLGDLRDFTAFVGQTATEPPGLDDVIRWFLALGPGAANANALMYRNHLLDDRKLAPATVCRRLAALRSVVDLARTLGLVSWSLEIRGPKVEARRDVRGPDDEERRKLWKCLRKLPDTRRNRRDAAVVALLFDLGLRRGEAAALELADLVDAPAGEIAIKGKGHREREYLTLPDPTLRALHAWLEARGRGPGPLFALTGEGIRSIVARLGRLAGLARPLRPHGLRHAAITAALDDGNDIRKVRKFSRHAKLETVIRYDDAREDTAGEIARGVSRERK